MNLRGIANSLTSSINPNIVATLRRSTGYTLSDSGRQVPNYAADEPITVQVQALTQKELQHLDKLNISNGQASVYANIQLSSVDRPSNSGGDIIVFGTDAKTPAGLRGQTWLVVALLEGWPGAGWSKAAITSQMQDPEA
ncbi:hypothetical protein AQZ52_10935 [Novosphingobium fuchskuhlense]|uniref:Uncharacterized protein n=1 Tax=Novosphingobium fuchskuhlense TaxID=1117702 RepID=A0A124JUF4_9SPHN|nr:hypothetical protein [Novosphingobium fuchskuhlense]KUR71178.1 hypothetical protein AQZ52_10935 [Novosphingobium fuchskuhlense]